MQQEKNDDVLVSPSFNSYSADGLAAIASRVSDQFMDDKDRIWESLNEDDDFEFSLVIGDEDVTADEFFTDGQIRPIFPIFNRDLVRNHDKDDQISDLAGDDGSVIRIPLKKLLTDDGEDQSSTSTSSSEADELEPIPAGTYCVWTPKFADQSPSRWRKSGSTGSGSKRWKLRDLLRRSNSEGKGPFVFFTPKLKEEKMDKVNPKERKNSGGGDGVIRKVKSGASPSRSPSSSPHETFYVRNRAERGGKRKSYLPYRQDLVGIFASVNGLGKSHPF